MAGEVAKLLDLGRQHGRFDNMLQAPGYGSSGLLKESAGETARHVLTHDLPLTGQS